MEPEVKRQLSKDYEEVDKAVMGILKGDEPNLQVRSNHYIHPTVYGIRLEHADPKGSLKHYHSIRNALVTALNTGKIPPEMKPGCSNLPSYICDLVE